MPFRRLLKIAGSRSSTRLPLLFECLTCKDKFTTEDVRKKRYYVETSICKKCYMVAAHTTAKVWCFGKLPKQNLPGYSSKDISCRLLCPDRRICQKFVKKLNKEK